MKVFPVTKGTHLVLLEEMYFKTQLSFHFKITKKIVKANLLTYHSGMVITKKN